MIGERPVLGRAFADADDKKGAEPVAILTNGMWKKRYGGDYNRPGSDDQGQQQSRHHRRRDGARHAVSEQRRSLDSTRAAARRHSSIRGARSEISV